MYDEFKGNGIFSPQHINIQSKETMKTILRGRGGGSILEENSKN